MKRRAAIVGLGQVGMLFDEDRKRKGVWTHFKAYERLARDFELVAVCDPDASRRTKALKRRKVRAYENLGTLLAEESLDVISLCTPPELHAEQVKACSGRVKAIICEKPLSADLTGAQEAVRSCQTSGTLLAVNYYKRYEATFAAMRDLIQKRKLGKLRFLRGLYTGPLGAVGSHMLDLFRFIGGEWTVRDSWRDPQSEDAWNAQLSGEGGLQAALHWAGLREHLIFELEAIGEKGRCAVLDNGDRLVWSLFKSSRRYSGYLELAAQKLPALRPVERFLPLFKDVEQALRSPALAALNVDGNSALNTQKLLHDIQLGNLVS